MLYILTLSGVRFLPYRVRPLSFFDWSGLNCFFASGSWVLFCWGFKALMLCTAGSCSTLPFLLSRRPVNVFLLFCFWYSALLFSPCTGQLGS